MIMTNGGYTVELNGVVAHKPDYMNSDYWFRYIVPRIGKAYGSKGYLYGAEFDTPTHGTEERGEGCDGGACAI